MRRSALQIPCPTGLMLLLVALAGLVPAGRAQVISTVAGTGAAGSTGDGGPATAATFNNPVSIAFGANGVYYIVDQDANVVRRIAANGVITRFAGTGAPGYNGDNQPAANAQLNSPAGVLVDTAGNVYIADGANARIRKVDTNGMITTIAGTGAAGFSGDGPGVATQMQLQCPVRLAQDGFGNLYVADQCNHRIRKIDRNGMMVTVAGSGTTGPSAGGFGGDGGPATAARFQHPTSIAVDGLGAIYITDQLNRRIRKVDRNGMVSTLINATANFPGSVAGDSAGNVYYSDPLVHRIYRIPLGVPTVTGDLIVGNGSGTSNGDGGPAVNATVNNPFGIAIDPFGDMYIAESAGRRIRKVVGMAPKAPTFTAAGVTNGASFQTGSVQAGSIATIFGVYVSNTNGLVTDGGVLPLPTQLGGTSVRVNNILARLYAVVNNNNVGQVNFQVPFELGPAAGAPAAVGEQFVEIVVSNLNTLSNAPVLVPLTASQPGIFVLNGFAAAQHVLTDGTLAVPARPAVRGETLALYCTGLGQVSHTPPSGTAAPISPLSEMPVRPTMTVGGVAADVGFGGLAPGFVGLYQVNFTVPPGAPSGTVNLVLTHAGVSSPAAPFPVQ